MRLLWWIIFLGVAFMGGITLGFVFQFPIGQILAFVFGGAWGILWPNLIAEPRNNLTL